MNVKPIPYLFKTLCINRFRITLYVKQSRFTITYIAVVGAECVLKIFQTKKLLKKITSL